jgi:hypothetical protein
MYILVNNARMILGLFSDKTWLNNAIKVVREAKPGTILYYQKVDVNTFNTVLPCFWTMHPERLIEIEKEKDYV